MARITAVGMVDTPTFHSQRWGVHVARAAQAAMKRGTSGYIAAEREIWVVVVAAGSGSRFGGPKQLEVLGDKRVIDWSLQAARPVAAGVILVSSAALLEELRESSVDALVIGGASRSDSVRAGLAALPESADIVVIHDAARPLAAPQLFADVVAAVRDGADAAIPGIPVSDTIKRVESMPSENSSSTVISTIDRSDLVAVQTPQAFRVSTLQQAHSGGAEATDDAALVEQIGGKVVVVPGDVSNFKITTPHDLVVARGLVES